MWWYLKKRFQNEEYVDYEYAFESYDTTGLIRYYFDDTYEILAVSDKGGESSADYLVQNFFGCIIEDEYCPETRMIACG